MQQDKQQAAAPPLSEGAEGERENTGKSSRGGARPGSGRKPRLGGKETGPTRSIRLPQEQEFDAKLRTIARRRQKTPEQILKLLAVEALEQYDEVKFTKESCL